MYYDCMEDCIHLHACRLLAKRYRDAGSRFVARFCNEECPAYQRMMHVDPDDGWFVPLYVIENGDCCHDEYEDDSNGYAISKKRAKHKLKPRKIKRNSRPDKYPYGLEKWSSKKHLAAEKEAEEPKKSVEPYKCSDESYIASSTACDEAFGNKK